MAASQKIVSALASRMPKVIDPKLHAVIDYAVAGTFLAVGAWFWKRQQKHAALSSFICGGALSLN